ncbi:MAG: hypothetical protein II343_01195, partial [Clostridia bacterium]|nr:hypothetical protein [Clostridia bacterium]
RLSSLHERVCERLTASQTPSETKVLFPRASIIFLFGYASRPENDIGSSVSTAPLGVHAAAAPFDASRDLDVIRLH